MASLFGALFNNLTRSDSAETAISDTTPDPSVSNAHSSSSTPPTSAAETASIDSASLKLDSSSVAEEDPDASEMTGSDSVKHRRSKHNNIIAYNARLKAGVVPPRKSRKSEGGNGKLTRRRTVSGDTLLGSLGNDSVDTVTRTANELVRTSINALDLEWDVKKFPRSKSQASLGAKLEKTMKSGKKDKHHSPGKRISTRSSGAPVEDFTRKLSVLGKRGRNALESSLIKSKRELLRLADTKEFAKIEDRPIYHTVWANGKLVPAGETSPPKKKAKIEAVIASPVKEEATAEVKPKILKKRTSKKWLAKGLYAGQQDLAASRTYLPLPIWHGERVISQGRDFKLPYDVCNPLPPGQPKPDEWKKVQKNRFFGDAAAAWKKSTLFDDFSSRCVCKPSTGCDESCQNRIMLYECDSGNCHFGTDHCSNRAFSELEDRRKKGGKYRIGVEVIKTADRGYGVRTNRCFEALQIITEYTGEIITENECDRRMNEDYKDNACYYLMSFDQNTILDATEKGSIARFVNHSCEPNCRMVKWVVGGKPRMALFAGDRDILTGEELTYDYNFDPFSAKNVQECRCGSSKCRGILGPKPKAGSKPAAAAAKVIVSLNAGLKRVGKAGKRKLKELLGGEDDEIEKEETTEKKRKIAVPTSMKRSLSAKSAQVVRSAKKRISSIGFASESAKSKKTAVTQVSKATLLNKVLTNGKGEKKQMKFSSRNSSWTIVAEDVDQEAEKKVVEKKTATKLKSPKKSTLSKKNLKSVKGRLGAGLKGASKSTIRIVVDDGDN